MDTLRVCVWGGSLWLGLLQNPLARRPGTLMLLVSRVTRKAVAAAQALLRRRDAAPQNRS